MYVISEELNTELELELKAINFHIILGPLLRAV
jgi:hypothetical protein